MAEEIKRMFVRIGGMSYQLVTTENEQYTRQIAAKADEMIHRVMQNNPQLSQNMSTILALVNAVDELNGLYQRLGSVDGQKAETEKQAAEARKELMRLREQNWEMKKEILRLNEINKYNQALIGKLTTPGDLAGGPEDRDQTAVAPDQAEPQQAPAEDTPANDAPALPQDGAELPGTTAAPVTAQQAGGSALLQDKHQTDVSTLKATRTEAKPGQADVTAVGELKQTNLDDYLKANGWSQTCEKKKHD